MALHVDVHRLLRVGDGVVEPGHRRGDERPDGRRVLTREPLLREHVEERVVRRSPVTEVEVVELLPRPRSAWTSSPNSVTATESYLPARSGATRSNPGSTTLTSPGSTSPVFSIVSNEARVDGISTTPAVVPARSAGSLARTPGAMAMPTGACVMRPGDGEQRRALADAHQRVRRVVQTELRLAGGDELDHVRGAGRQRLLHRQSGVRVEALLLGHVDGDVEHPGDPVHDERDVATSGAAAAAADAPPDPAAARRRDRLLAAAGGEREAGEHCRREQAARRPPGAADGRGGTARS